MSTVLILGQLTVKYSSDLFERKNKSVRLREEMTGLFRPRQPDNSNLRRRGQYERKRAKESSVISVYKSLQWERCLNPAKSVGKVVRIQPDNVSMVRRLHEKRSGAGASQYSRQHTATISIHFRV